MTKSDKKLIAEKISSREVIVRTIDLCKCKNFSSIKFIFEVIELQDLHCNLAHDLNQD